MPDMGIAVATELSSGAISSILEAVPGIATVLRSPVADAIVNLSRAGAGLAPFDPKYAHELIRYAVRRGLIRSDEGDRVAAEIEAVHPTRPEKPAPKAAPPPAVHPAAAPRHPFGRRPHSAAPAPAPAPAAAPAPVAAAPHKPAPAHQPAAKHGHQAKPGHKAKPAPKAKPAAKKTKPHHKPKAKPRPKAKAKAKGAAKKKK